MVGNLPTQKGGGMPMSKALHESASSGAGAALRDDSSEVFVRQSSVAELNSLLALRDAQRVADYWRGSARTGFLVTVYLDKDGRFFKRINDFVYVMRLSLKAQLTIRRWHHDANKRRAPKPTPGNPNPRRTLMDWFDLAMLDAEG